MQNRVLIPTCLLVLLAPALVAQTQACSMPGIAIPDNDPLGTTDLLNVAASGTISNLTVDLVVTHTWVGDVYVELTHVPSGTTVRLLDRPGIPATMFGCQEDNVDCTFDDASMVPAETECALAPAPAIGGVVQPEQPLSAFNGLDVNGDWVLFISDGAAGDTGTLVSWCINYTTGGGGPPGGWTIDAPPCVTPMGTIDVDILADSGLIQQAAAQFTITWDPTVFQLDAGFGIGGAQFNGSWDGVANTTVPGELRVAQWHLPAYPTGASNLLTFRLQHIGGFGTLPIAGDVEVWGDPMLNDIGMPPFALTPDMVTIGCVPLPSCSISDPTFGQLITATHNVLFSTANPSMNNLDLTFEYRVAAGPWMMCTPTMASALPNPAPGTAPGAQSFEWDLNTDFFLPVNDVDFRVTVVDSVTMNGNTCQVNVDVDIVNGTPMCVVTAPATMGMVFAPSQTITFDLTDTDMNPVDISYEVDTGMGFTPATRMGGGPSVDPQVMPAAGLTFDWDVSADVPSPPVSGVVFRLSLDDRRPMGTSSCDVMFDVRPPNNVPTCNLFFPGMGSTVTATQTMLFSTADGDSDPLDIVLEFDAGAGFMLATPTGGSALPNPATGVPPSGANSFTWDINADIAMSGSVDFRITVDDGLPGGTNTCMTTWNVNVPMSPPTCSITSPLTASTISGPTMVTFDTVDAESNPLEITFEFDAGSGFTPATATAGSALPSPAMGVPPQTGNTFEWDVGADIVGSASGVLFRITVDDGFGGSNVCAVQVNVLGIGLCPSPGDCGDCNMDGILNILDSLTASQAAAGIVTIMPGTLQFNSCNVNGAVEPAPGASIDVLDSLRIAQAAAGLPAMLACC